MKNFLYFVLPFIAAFLLTSKTHAQCEADFEFEQVDGTYIMNFFSTSSSEHDIISYFWDFGDGHEGDGQNPSHEYDEPGPYLVCLTIEDSEGCTDEQCHDFFIEEISSECEADFEWEQIPGTLNVQFFNTSFSDHDIISFEWGFGDGQEGDGANPIHEYDEPGVYVVCLIITNSEGCVSDVCHEVVVEAVAGGCEANFEFEQVDGTYIMNFFSTSSSDHDIISYFWDFGDGHEGDGQNPSHEYDEPGPYLVCLTIEDSEGCTDEQCHDFFIEEISSECEADFEWEQIPGTLNVQFFNTSFSDHDIISFEWGFGDGQEGDGANPIHEYDEPGVYVVCLIITNSEGCVSDVCHEVVVEAVAGGCEADFEFEQVDGTYIMNFFSTSSSEHDIISYFWDFGDGHEGDGQNPSHEYDEPGPYLVCLTIEDSEGCTDEQCHDFFIEEISSECEADFEWEQIPGTLNVQFFNTSSSDHDIISFNWNFGDGHEGDGANPTHEYDEPGVYVVCLIIENAEGCESDVCYEVVVEGVSGDCEADFEFEQVDGTYIMNFFSTSSSEHDIISYFWDFGDGHEGDGQNPSHEYDEPGPYLVCLTIEDSEGCTDEQCHDFFIEEISSECEADFEWEQIPGTLNVQFFNTSSSDHDIISFNWNFGDGHEGDGANPTHEYDEPGVYVVCLIIENAEGCESDVCYEVVVEGVSGDCEADFEFEQVDGTYIMNFFSTSSSEHDIISYFWDFGDGHEGDGQNPSHEYDEPGPYLVCLTIEDSEGCTDEQCHDFFIEEIPADCNAEFEWEQIPGTLSIHFINQSTSDHDIISYLWTFGDGHSGDGQNPTHEYDEPGVYVVCLRIEDNSGCVSEVCHEVVVEEAMSDCHAQFEWEQIPGTLNIHFINQSTSDHDIISYLWTFGDGHSSDGQNPTHEYDEPGVYVVCLRIEDNSGCVSEVCHEVVVEEAMSDCHAQFEWEQIPGTLNIHFINQSTSDHDIISYLWTFGDGHSGDGQNPTHEYDEPGVYLVCLRIEDNSGCVSEVCHEVVVEGIEDCEASFNFEIDDDDVIHFNNTSTGATPHTTWFWEFGDGNTSTEENPTHEYEEPGIYTICLTMEDETTDCLDEFCLPVVYQLGWEDAHFDEPREKTKHPPHTLRSQGDDFRIVRFNNPVSNNLYIRYELENESQVRFEMYDLTGNRVMTSNQGRQSNGTQETSLDVSFLHPGLYILTVKTDSSVKTMTLYVTR